MVEQSEAVKSAQSKVFGASPDAAWRPGPEVTDRSRLLTAMRRWGFDNIESLQEAAIADPAWFWSAVVDDLAVDFETPYRSVIDESKGKVFPRWFVGGKLNAATLCSHRHASGELAHNKAVVYEGDNGQHRSLTFAELDDQVRTFAAHLVQLGVQRGDRIVLFLPVVPEAVIAYLAIAMIGAIVVPAFTGYGPEALAMRLRDSQAVMLITADGTTRRGKKRSPEGDSR